jgi:hypothetical protein
VVRGSFRFRFDLLQVGSDTEGGDDVQEVIAQAATILLVDQNRGVGRAEHDGVDGFAQTGRECAIDLLYGGKK